MADGSALAETVPTSVALRALIKGELTLEGRFRAGSNYTFLVSVTYQGRRVPAVYKPTRGERPLWDFPSGTLAKREVAAFVVSEMLGWGFVPPTVYRDGPHGPGSVQFYIDIDPEGHYLNFSEEEKAACQRVAAFDYIANNADRKGGHVVYDRYGKLWLIDHGICFHTEYKLRTVVWEFAGEAIPDDVLSDAQAFRSVLGSDDELAVMLRQFLSADELGGLGWRTDQLIRLGCFPTPGPGCNYPWPAL